MTAQIIWDRDHGPENQGYYLRLRWDDGQDEDIALDTNNAQDARAEVLRCYPDAEIIRCDDPA